MKNRNNDIRTASKEDIIKMEEDVLRQYKKADKKHPILTIIKMCKGFYNELFISAIFCVLQLAASLVFPITTANAIDAVTIGGDKGLKIIIINLSIAAFLLAINYPMQRLYIKSRNGVMRSIEITLRGAVVMKLQNLTLQWGKENPTGKVQSKIMNNVDSIRIMIENIHTNGIHILVNVGTVIGVILFKSDWIVLILFLVSAPLMLIITKAFKKDIKKENHEYRIALEDTYSKVFEMLDLLPVTKAHALGNYEIDKMNSQFTVAAKAAYKADDVNSRYTIVSWFVMQIFRVLCLIVTIYLAFEGKLSIGDVTLYNTYYSTYLTYVKLMLDVLPVLTSGAEAVNSIGEILNSDDVETNNGKFEFSELKGEFDFNNVKFEYRDGKSRVLNGLDLHVDAAQTIALVGESGSGKSTIINIVTGFYLANSGRVTLDGIDMKDIDMRSYRKFISVVPQNSTLFSGTIRENITYGLENVSDDELKTVVEQACLTDVIANLPDGLDTMVGEHGTKLSGGQCQRVAIARALIRNPKVIILDEATSALDTVSEKHIQHAIENLSKDKTTFIVAHRLSTIKNADKIAVIANGKCVEYGTFDELVALKGEFYKFRSMQI